MKIFFSVGEPSGDLHGGNLIRQLRELHPDVECVGYGGPKMAAAGCDLHFDLTELAVMFIGKVLLNIQTFWRLASEADRYFRHHKPDAVVLIDYPGFNWWIARRAKAHGIPVFYYGVPQIWAWARWRVHKMRRLVDHALCKLPFEQPWLRQRGINAHHIGHPYFDQLRNQLLDEDFITSQTSQTGPLVTLLPGSRTQEVKKNLPALLEAARLVRQQVPDARFAVAAYKAAHLEMANESIQKIKGQDSQLDIEIYTGRTQELMQAATCCMATSGSVSLELLYRQKPCAIHYKIGPVAFAVLSRLVKVPYMTLVNYLSDKQAFERPFIPYHPDNEGADQVVYPEYPTIVDRSAEMADNVITWLIDDEERQRVIDRLAEIKAEVSHGGASRKAAEYISRELTTAAPVLPQPHHQPRRAA